VYCFELFTESAITDKDVVIRQRIHICNVLCKLKQECDDYIAGNVSWLAEAPNSYCKRTKHTHTHIPKFSAGLLK